MSKPQRDNSGALFKNDKGGNEQRPDYTGSLRIAGAEYWLSAWIKEGQKGKFMSLAVKPKDANVPAAQPYRGDVDSDIPF